MHRGRPLIGLSWQGNPAQEKLAGRSLPLERLAPLTELSEVDFVSFQRGPGEEQLDSCSFRHRFCAAQNELNNIWAFEEIAAMMCGCDCIVSVDTATAHLAGALGCPTWLLLRHVPEWRWGIESKTVNSYPSMTLLRQHKPHDWCGPIQELKDALSLKYSLPPC
jgi:ADP-heptose:LPS heptosyltransferase